MRQISRLGNLKSRTTPRRDVKTSRKGFALLGGLLYSPLLVPSLTRPAPDDTFTPPRRAYLSYNKDSRDGLLTMVSIEGVVYF